MSLLICSFLAFSLPAAPQFAVPSVAPAQHGSPNSMGTLSASTCEPSWSSMFGGWPGAGGEVKATCVYDDGSGPALYTGQDWGIRRWDGSAWGGVGSISGIHFRSVTSLAVFDDGRGDALYVGGHFDYAGGVLSPDLARWDGTTWERPGTGAPWWVEALCVYDDGSGPALYVGSRLGTVKRWDGTQWTTVASANEAIQGMLVHDDGSGSKLYVSGLFTTMDGQPAQHIVAWDGVSWSAVGSGLGGNTLDLEVFDEGQGPRLFAAGLFDHAGGQPAQQIARWDGAQWTPLGLGLDFIVECLEVYDEGQGPRLFAGGHFTAAGGAPANKIARWDGSSWSEAGGGLGGGYNQVRALTVYDDGQGPELFVGGVFFTVGTVEANCLVAWNGSAWQEVGERGLDNQITSLRVHDDGNGPALFASGYFTALGTTPLGRILRWDGQTATPLGSGSTVPIGILASYDAGQGAELIVTGDFAEIGGVPAARIARWDGTTWNSLGSGIGGGWVSAGAVFDRGSGPALYVAGSFTSAGGHSVGGLARWDGTDWSPVPGNLNGAVYSMAAFDDGGGPALFVGGLFTQVGDLIAQGIAKWDGSTWHAMGTTQGTFGRNMILYDDSSGPALYVSGIIRTAAPPIERRIARWNGQGFVSLGGGTWSTSPLTLAVYDDGRGPALYAGGSFTLTTDVTITHMARWDGAEWGAVPNAPTSIRALEPFDAGNGTALFAVRLDSASPGNNYLYQLEGCPPRFDRSYCFGTAAQCPCGNPGGYQAGCGNSNGIGGSLVAGGSGSLLADDLTLSASELMILQPALLFAGTNALNAGLGVPFGDGLRCAGGAVRRLGVRTTSMLGAANWGPALLSQGTFAAGATARFQVWYRDPSGSPCGTGFNLTNGMAVTVSR